MTPNAFLDSLLRADFTLRVEGDRLVIAPGSLLTDEQRAFIRANKPELIRLVLASVWDDVDFTALEPDWQTGAVQMTEGVVVDLWGRKVAITQEMAAVLFRPSAKPADGAFRLRKPCQACQGKWGRLARKTGQDTVWCQGCGKYQYNAPRAETGLF